MVEDVKLLPEEPFILLHFLCIVHGRKCLVSAVQVSFAVAERDRALVLDECLALHAILIFLVMHGAAQEMMRQEGQAVDDVALPPAKDGGEAAVSPLRRRKAGELGENRVRIDGADELVHNARLRHARTAEHHRAVRHVVVDDPRLPAPHRRKSASHTCWKRIGHSPGRCGYMRPPRCPWRRPCMTPFYSIQCCIHHFTRMNFPVNVHYLFIVARTMRIKRKIGGCFMWHFAT